MSYPRDPDEYTEQELRMELAVRYARRATGVCDYCERPPDTPPCRFPERHHALRGIVGAGLRDPRPAGLREHLAAFRYQSSTGLGERGLMEHHIEALTEYLVGLGYQQP